jgi:hypothetical protein
MTHQISPDIQLDELQDSPPDAPVVMESEATSLSKGRTIIVIAALAGVNFLSSLTNGLLTVGLPRIANDIGLAEHLLLW